MNKKEKITLGIIALETFFTVFLYFNLSPSAVCSSFGLINPFGTAEQLPIAAQACANNTYFYLAADLLILSLLAYLVYLIVKKPKWVRSLNSILLSIMAISGILSAFFFFVQDGCGSGCGNKYSFLNPLGHVEKSSGPEICPSVCTRMPHPPFYIITDLLIITVVLYLIYRIIKRLTLNKQT